MSEGPPRAAVVRQGRLVVDGREVDTRHAVVAACVAGTQIVVLYDPDADRRTWGVFRNLAAVDMEGTELWVADPPTTTTGDCFVRIDSCDPLVAGSWSSFDCIIDPDTGRILNSTVTK